MEKEFEVNENDKGEYGEKCRRMNPQNLKNNEEMKMAEDEFKLKKKVHGN